MFVTRSFIQSHRSWLFIYGDNFVYRGYGGQAKECRGEPNTLGIPTKHYPSMSPDAFFADTDFTRVKLVIDDLIALINFSFYKKVVVLPGIGEGRAQLPTRAPKIWNYLQKCLAKLKEEK